MVGKVRSHTDNANTSMVEVEFHDTATYHTFTVPNMVGLSMAALSRTTLALACERIEEEPRSVRGNVYVMRDVQQKLRVVSSIYNLLIYVCASFISFLCLS